VAGWVGRWRLATAELELGPADHERVTAVREGFRALLRANSRMPLDKDAVARLDRWSVVICRGSQRRVSRSVDGCHG